MLVTKPIPLRRTPPRIGIVLTEELVVDIYKCKLALTTPINSGASAQNDKGTRGQSVQVSERFGVSPKTVRDIWNHRTWAYVTFPLWVDKNLSQESIQIPLKGRPGRPKGSRQSAARASACSRDQLHPFNETKTITDVHLMHCDVADYVCTTASNPSVCQICKHSIPRTRDQRTNRKPRDCTESISIAGEDPTEHDPFYHDWHNW